MSVRSKRTFKSNQDLWQAFLSSDKEAFACLFEEYADAMYAYGCKMTSDAELVKDAIQDVFVKLYKNRLSLRENVMIKGYLFVALKRTLLNLLHTHAMLSLEDGDGVCFKIDLLSQRFYEEDSSCGCCEEEETRQQLLKAFDELTDRQREAIYLYYIQEIPLNELSVLSINEKSYTSCHDEVASAHSAYLLREYTIAFGPIPFRVRAFQCGGSTPCFS